MARCSEIPKESAVAWLLVEHPGGDWTELYMDVNGKILPRGTKGPKGPYLFTGAAWWSAGAATAIPENCFDVRDFLSGYDRHFGVLVEPFDWLEVGTPDQLIHAASKLAPDNEGRVSGNYIYPTATEHRTISRCILGPGVCLPHDRRDSDGFWFLRDGILNRQELR
jgi:hypothetical protein